MSFRVVETQRQALDVAAHSAVGFELLQLRAAIPNRPGDGGAVKFDPGIGAGQGMQTALQMNLPTADFEIEVVLAIALRGWAAVLGASEFC
jgi:hypothetical protein